MRGKVAWDGQMLVLLDGGLEPLLAMLGEIIMSQERYCNGLRR